MKMLPLSSKNNKVFFMVVLFMLGIYMNTEAAISVSQFLTADDVTVAHLETQRSTFQGAINTADGGLLQTATVTSAKLDANTNPENRWNESFNDYVYTGLLPPTTTDTLTSTTTAGTAYVYGVRVVKDATPNEYTASKHTYVDLSNTGTYTYSEVEINSSAPSVAANSIRLALVSTDTSKVLSVTDKRVTSISTLSIKLGTFDRDISLTTDLAITGVGFTPKAVDFLTYFSSAVSQGFDNVTAKYSITTYGTTPTYYSNSAGLQATVDGSNYMIGYISTMDSDGFTLSFSKVGAPTGSIAVYFKAYR